jgi:hypothetical protein
MYERHLDLVVDLVLTQVEYELECCNHFSDFPLSAWEIM